MNGVIIINKSKGYTSHDIVNIIRKQLNIKKVGHTGTLDPNATGVLPILLGQATKISKYLIEHNKTYIAELVLGKKTTTGDSEGEIIEKKVIPKLTTNEIKDVLDSFLGKQKQIPPIYSSIKINGKKAYEYARRGQKINLQERDIEIFKINLIDYKENTIKFEVKCSKGTYIRTLCEDIATKLGTVGHMNNLQRTQVDNFDISNSITIEEIKENPEIASKYVVGIQEVFKSNKKLRLNDYRTKLFLNGVRLTYKENNGVYTIYNNEKFLGLGIINDNLLKRDVIVDY